MGVVIVVSAEKGWPSILELLLYHYTALICHFADVVMLGANATSTENKK